MVPLYRSWMTEEQRKAEDEYWERRYREQDEKAERRRRWIEETSPCPHCGRRPRMPKDLR
jgi:hypothetical protein